mgnify:CR=1 FL=1|jgi:hypothetical protein
MWTCVVDVEGRVYYHNQITNKSEWELPGEVCILQEHVGAVVQVHRTSRLHTCLRIGLHAQMRSFFETWVLALRARSRRHVPILAGMLSEWMKMRSIATAKVAEILHLENITKDMSDRILAFENVEAADKEWDSLLWNSKHTSKV